jgi:thiamine biosynthesis lipoprotein
MLATLPSRIAVPAQISPGALTGHDRSAPVIDLGGATMGTTWHVRLAEPAGLDPQALHRTIGERLDRIVAEMSHWEPDSALSRFNWSAAGSWTALPDDFATVIEAALDIAERTGGAFDPAIGALVNLWGFGPIPVTAPPSDMAIAGVRQSSGWRRLAYDAPARRLRQPGGLMLDLSGIAKGYAVDAVAALLARHGVRHCLIEIGGELVGRGLKPDGDPWWVDLETPPGAALAPFRIALHDLSIATSGDYVRGDHNLDPTTGRPATQGVISASVLHRSAMVADAWASALTVLGADAATALAIREDIAARIVTQSSSGAKEMITPALAGLL